MQFCYDDGGRVDAGFKGMARDCVARSIAIATKLPYLEVYEAINQLAQRERPRTGRKRSKAREGVWRATYHRYITDVLGWKWQPCMGIGTGCKVHLREGELPSGRLIIRCSKHLTSVIDGVIHDTWDPSRDGTRCVYGYYYKSEQLA